MLPAAALAFQLAVHTTEGGKREDRVSAGAAQKKEPEQKDKKPKKKKAKDKDKAKDKEYPQFKLDDHPSIHLAKGTHIDFKGRFAADVTDSDAPAADTTEAAAVDLGKRRVGVEGEIHNDVEFQVEAELASTNTWRDVYADFKHFDAIRVRGGHFKLPFSLDELTSPTHLDFMFRSLAATHLAPGRDTGVMVHGRVVAKTINYEVGVFDHDGKNARTSNPDKVYGGQTVAARVTFEPLRNRKDAGADLSVGGAFTTSDVPEGIGGVRGLMVHDQKFFSAGNFTVNGKRRRTGVEFQLRPGPASVKGEWIRLATERKGESVEDTDLSPLVGQGWYVSATYAVTGEKKSRLDRPKKPLFQGGAGAIEVAGRVESLEFKSGDGSEAPSRSPRAESVLGNRDKVVTVGVNWYVNRFVKIQGNFIREQLADPSQGPLPPQSTFTTKAVRFQLSF